MLFTLLPYNAVALLRMCGTAQSRRGSLTSTPGALTQPASFQTLPSHISTES